MNPIDPSSQVRIDIPLLQLPSEDKPVHSSCADVGAALDKGESDRIKPCAIHLNVRRAKVVDASKFSKTEMIILVITGHG